MKINAREMVINANPTTIKILCPLPDDAPLNNRIAPISPKNNAAMPWITGSKDTCCVISGKKMPASSAKNASR